MKKKILLIPFVVVLLLIIFGIYYDYSVNGSYELKITRGTTYLQIGFQQYSFTYGEPLPYGYNFTVRCGSASYTINLEDGIPRGKTYQMLDLEVYFKEDVFVNVDCFKIIVRKW